MMFLLITIYFIAQFVIQTTEGRKNLGNAMVGVNVDVREILRREAPLDDNGCGYIIHLTAYGRAPGFV